MAKFNAGDIITVINKKPKPLFLVCSVINKQSRTYAQYEIFRYDTKTKIRVSCENIDKTFEFVKKAGKWDDLLYN